MAIRRHPWQCLGAALLLASTEAHDAAAQPSAPAVALPDRPEPPSRALPNYDGRGYQPMPAGERLLWVPRVVLSPFYLISEFGLRRPLGWLMTTAEREQWPSVIRNFFTFGDEGKAGVFPTAFIDFGFRPSVGIYAFWDDLLGPGQHLRLHASTWGHDWLQGSVANKFSVGRQGVVDLRVEGLRRPDQLFYGIGPRSLQGNESRFGLDRVAIRPTFETRWWRGSRFSAEGGIKYVAYNDAACCGDPSINDRVATGALAPPPGYESGFTTVYERAELTLDTRSELPASQTGVRLEASVEQDSSLRRSRDNWVSYGASVGGFWDIRNHRMVSLSAATFFVDPLSEGSVVPFTEEWFLGGSGPMRGFLTGRLVDRSAAALTLKYRWPIWTFLDGTMQAGTGNVFGPQLQDFKPKLLRVSGAIGVESIGAVDNTFEILMGVGSETFEDGTKFDSFRLVLGGNRSF